MVCLPRSTASHRKGAKTWLRRLVTVAVLQKVTKLSARMWRCSVELLFPLHCEDAPLTVQCSCVWVPLDVTDADHALPSPTDGRRCGERSWTSSSFTSLPFQQHLTFNRPDAHPPPHPKRNTKTAQERQTASRQPARQLEQHRGWLC